MKQSTITREIDLYRDIHKGLRHGLFEATFEAGRLEVTDDEAVRQLVTRVHEVAAMLAAHHEHEDAPVLDDLLEEHNPDLRARIVADHVELAVAIDALPSIADELAATAPEARRPIAHRLYLELAAFTSAYLAHLDVEERQVMPLLTQRCTPDELLRVNIAIVSSIPLEARRRATKYMVAAMNLDERAGLLGQVQAAAPPAVFDMLWAVAERALKPTERAQLAARLGVGA
jgi:hypothetical protein